jgi:hypothetical protein
MLPFGRQYGQKHEKSALCNRLNHPAAKDCAAAAVLMASIAAVLTGWRWAWASMHLTKHELR